MLPRLVSSTRNPELKMKKSSFEMRSPGREVKLVDWRAVPFRGKFQVLKILSRNEYRLWVPWVI
jgi:hypothetical protein